MKATRLLPVLLVFIAAVPMATAQSHMTVYSHDFQTPVGPEWSQGDRTTSPNLTRTFLGRFGGEPVDLLLVGLPDHCSVTVTFELLVIGSWEGSVGHDAGADIFDVNAATPGDCCPVENLLHTTFANCNCRFQAYPETYPDVHLPGLTGAALLPPAVRDRFKEVTGCTLYEILGMTEASGLISIDPLNGEGCASSVGWALPYTQVEILKLNADGSLGEVCSAHEIGVISIRGEHISPGYRDPYHNVGVFKDGQLN